MITDPAFLPNLLARIAEFSCRCLESTPNGRPAFCGLYHNTAPADCCDALWVSIERITAIEQFPLEASGPLKCNTTIPMVSGVIQLFRPCWPTVVMDPGNPFPAASAMDAASALLMIDGLALYCCLLTDLSDTYGFIKDGNPLAARLGQATPDRPSGGCVSWKLRFQIELDPCCGAPVFVPPPQGS